MGPYVDTGISQALMQVNFEKFSAIPAADGGPNKHIERLADAAREYTYKLDFNNRFSFTKVFLPRTLEFDEKGPYYHYLLFDVKFRDDPFYIGNPRFLESAHLRNKFSVDQTHLMEYQRDLDIDFFANKMIFPRAAEMFRAKCAAYGGLLPVYPLEYTNFDNDDVNKLNTYIRWNRKRNELLLKRRRAMMSGEEVNDSDADEDVEMGSEEEEEEGAAGGSEL